MKQFIGIVTATKGLLLNGAKIDASIPLSETKATAWCEASIQVNRDAGRKPAGKFELIEYACTD